MSETLVTVTGNVATAPELRTTSAGAQVARFRVATTERRYDRAAERWSDGHTNFFTVWAWRNLGENVMASLGVGDPVIVQGKLRVTEREEQGRTYLSASIDAVTVGHDLNRGTAAFRRVVKTRGDWAPDPFAMPLDPAPPAPGESGGVAPDGARGQSEAPPADAPGESSGDARGAGARPPVARAATPPRSTGRKRTAPPAAEPAPDPELVPF